MKQKKFLRDDSQTTAQVALSYVPHWYTIQPDISTCGVIKSCSQREHRGFARPTGTDQRGKLAEWSSEGNIMQHFFITCLAGITEIDTIEDNALPWSCGKRLW